MAEAYKLKADASFPQAIRQADELADGTAVYETVGRNYPEGSYVLASEMTPRDRERAENGDLDHLLESASVKDAEAYNASVDPQYGTFIPEHEAEAVVLEEYGHQIVPRDQVIEAKSAGAEAAKNNLEAAKAEGRDERPGITAREFPSLADVSRGDASPAEGDSEHLEAEALRGVEQPPGFPVGPDLAEAEGGDADPKPRSRPRRSGSKKEEGEQSSSEGSKE